MRGCGAATSGEPTGGSPSSAASAGGPHFPRDAAEIPDVGCGCHQTYAGSAFRYADPNGRDARMGMGRTQKHGAKFAGQRDVFYESSFAPKQAPIFRAQSRLADRADRSFRHQFRAVVHGRY